MEQEKKLNSQIENSESITTDEAKERAKSKNSMFYEFDWFPITTSPWIAALSFIFQFVFVIHSIDFYSDMANTVLGNNESFRLISNFDTKNFASIAFLLTVLLSMACLLSLFFNQSEEQEGYKYILVSIGSKLFPFLRYLIDANLSLAAIFLIRCPTVAVCFVLAAFLNILINFVCQNYNLRKDYLCCRSIEFLLLWKISLIVGFAINCAGYYLIGTSQTVLLAFLMIQFLIFSVLLALYFSFGYLIYRHTSSQTYLIIFLNLFCAITMGNAYDLIHTMISGEFVPNRNLISSTCLFISLLIMSLCIWTKIKKEGSSIENKSAIKKIYFLFNKLENSSENISDDCEIRGIIRYHLCHLCTNPNCFVNQNMESFYDSKKNSYSFPNKLNQGKTTFVKLIVKCIFEQELDNQKWKNTDLLLDYIEFYFMKLKNLFKVSILLVELEKRFLTPFQRIRLVRLRRFMFEENRKLNEELYNNHLDLENLICAENKFDEIQFQIKDTLQKNIQFWKYLENDSINLSLMIKMMKPTFELIEKINNNWKKIAKYFEIQKVWKFLFVCYTLYIKNEKVKPQFLEEFGQSVNEEELFILECLHIDKTTEENKLFISKMIFEKEVCCIHINHSQEKPIIKSVSRYFEKLFGYQKIEVIETSLEILMPECFKNMHRRKFMKWAGEGKSSKESNYDVKKIFPINKDGFIICTFKFYKQFLNLNKDLQYVAMFKKNREEENVIILNQNYEIEGMTKSAVDKLGLSHKDYQDTIGMNLLIFLPSLIEYTSFEELREAACFDITTSLELSNMKGKNPADKSKIKKVEISTKKEFTKNNMIIELPYYVENIRDVYLEERGEGNKQQIFDGICKSILTLHKGELKERYKVEVEIKQISLEEDTYFEFYIREIEKMDREANRNDSRFTCKQQNFNHDEDSINEEDLNNLFDNSQNSQNISLSFNSNIFIKEDNNQPVKMISHVKEISLFVRLMFCLFFTLLIGSFVLEFINYEKYEDNAEIMNALVGMQLKTGRLINKYHSLVLGLPGSNLKVSDMTEELRDIKEKSPEFKKAIFDSSITPEIINKVSDGRLSKYYFYDQTDLMDTAFLKIYEILYFLKGNPAANIETFLDLEYILLPWETMITNCIDNISVKFNRIYEFMEMKNTIFYGIVGVLLPFGFFFVLWRLFKVTNSFVSLMEIFTQFNDADLKKIIKYCYFLKQMFEHLTKKYEEVHDTSKSIVERSRERHLKLESNQQSSGLKITNVADHVTNEEESERDNANLNKKVKKIENGKELDNLKLRSITFVVMFLVICGAISFGLNAYVKTVNDGVIEMKDSGHGIFKYYSSIICYMIVYKDRKIYDPKIFKLGPYQSFFNKMKEMKKLTRVESGILNADFVKLRNNILFNNICELYPEVLEVSKRTKAECKEIASQTLIYGIMSYVFYEVNQVDYYLAKADNVYDPFITYQLEAGTELASTYLNYLAEEWNKNFHTILQNLRKNIIILLVCLFLLQVLSYILLIEILVVGNLKGSFFVFIKIYNNLVPDMIVTKQKTIKAKLEVEGIIGR